MTATPDQPAVFCRATQPSFLRLISTPSLQTTYGTGQLSNSAALEILDGLLQSTKVTYQEESPGLENLWKRLAARATSSPKVWMDAYLAAFAIKAGHILETFDQGFRSFEKEGLSLRLLSSD